MKHLKIIYDGEVEFKYKRMTLEELNMLKLHGEGTVNRDNFYRKKNLMLIEEGRIKKLNPQFKKKSEFSRIYFLKKQFFGAEEFCEDLPKRQSDAMVLSEYCKIVKIPLDKLLNQIPNLKGKLIEKGRTLMKSAHEEAPLRVQIAYNLQHASKKFEKSQMRVKFPRSLLQMSQKDLMKKRNAQRIIQNKKPIAKAKKEQILREVALYKASSKTKKGFLKCLERNYGEKSVSFVSREALMQERSKRMEEGDDGVKCSKKRKKRRKLEEKYFFDFKDFLNPDQIKKIERKKKRELIRYEQDKRFRENYENKSRKNKKEQRRVSLLDRNDYLKKMKSQSIFFREGSCPKIALQSQNRKTRSILESDLGDSIMIRIKSVDKVQSISRCHFDNIEYSKPIKEVVDRFSTIDKLDKQNETPYLSQMKKTKKKRAKLIKYRGTESVGDIQAGLETGASFLPRMKIKHRLNKSDNKDLEIEGVGSQFELSTVGRRKGKGFLFGAHFLCRH